MEDKPGIIKTLNPIILNAWASRPTNDNAYAYINGYRFPEYIS